MKSLRPVLLAAAVSIAGPGAAIAHVTINSGPAASNVSTIVTFQIGHGCSALNSATETQKYDTKSLTINFPRDVNGKALVSGVRPVPNPALGGNATITTDAAGVTSVTWTKADADVAASDVNFYTLQVYLKPATTDGTTATADPTFSQVQFTAAQVCKDPVHGTTATVHWDGAKHADPWQTATSCSADGDCTTGTTCDTTAHTCMLAAEPAPTLSIVDKRLPGWNHYSITTHIPDPAAYFADAQIVWMLTQQDGCATPPCAYSANPAIMMAIGATAGVTAANGGIHPDGDIWVKY